MSVIRKAETFKHLTQREHVLLRPENYLGPNPMIAHQRYGWCYSSEGKLEWKSYNMPWGLERIATDCMQNMSDAFRKGKQAGMYSIPPAYIKFSDNNVTMENGGSVPEVGKHSNGMELIRMLFLELGSSDNFGESKEEDNPVLGMNGWGGKLFNILSEKSTVRTSDNHLSQTMHTTNNAQHVVVDPPVPNSSHEGSVHISYDFDKSRFNYDKYSIEDIDHFRAHALFACVFSQMDIIFEYNGVKQHIKPINIKELGRMAFGEKAEGKPVVGKLWKVGRNYFANEPKDANAQLLLDYVVFFMPEDGDRHISAFNGSLTSANGEHVESVLSGVTACVLSTLENDNRLNLTFTRTHICTVVVLDDHEKNLNGNTKTKVERFSPKLKISDYNKDLIKSSPLRLWCEDAIKHKLLQNIAVGSKKNSRKVYDGLTEANYACLARSNRKDSRPVVMIIGEGKSAANTLLLYTQDDRDHYGVFATRGKPINLLKKGLIQGLKNIEIAALLDILNLDPLLTYETQADLRTLRYDEVWLAADTDDDGDAIRTMEIVNFSVISPTLCKVEGFFKIMLFPLVMAQKGSTYYPFYSLPEFEVWKSTHNVANMRVKYCKGIGGFNKEERNALHKNNFVIMQNIIYNNGYEHVLDKLQGKGGEQYRKELLYNYSPSKDVCRTKSSRINVTEIVPEYLARYAYRSVKRALPSIDSFKESGLKVACAALEKFKPTTSLISVQSFSGAVKELMGYHPGLAILEKCINNMTRTHTGTQNLPLFNADGTFQSRYLDKDSQARYLSIGPPPYWFHLFPKSLNEGIGHVIGDGGLPEEKKYLAQPLPLILVNGARGPAFAWNTLIYPTKPLEVYERLEAFLNDKPLDKYPPLKPWFRDFKGTTEMVLTSSLEPALVTEIKDASADKDDIEFEVESPEEKEAIQALEALPTSITSPNKERWGKYTVIFTGLYTYNTTTGVVHVTEIPPEHTVSTYTRFLDKLQKDGIISRYEDNCTESFILFKIYNMKEPSVKALGLREVRRLSNMNLFIDDFVVHYESYEEILNAYLKHTLPDYEKLLTRKIEETKTAAQRLNDTAKFLSLVGEGKIAYIGSAYENVKASAAKYGIDYDSLPNFPPNAFFKIDTQSYLKRATEALLIHDKLLKSTPKQLWLEDLQLLKPYL